MRVREGFLLVILTILPVLADTGRARADDGCVRKLLREANPFSQPAPGSGPIHAVFIAGFAGVAPPPPPLPPGVPRRYEPTLFAVPVGWLLHPFHGHEECLRR